MRRSRLRMLCMAGGLAAGCADYGTYEVRWQFAGSDVERVSADCGLHGVDSIHVVGSSSGGERDDFTGLCTRGMLTRSVPVGTWSFSVHQVDTRGVLVDPVDENLQPVAPTVTGVIADGTTVALDLVELVPRPECRDRVDNDRDGRVDLDDLGCRGDANGAAE